MIAGCTWRSYLRPRTFRAAGIVVAISNLEQTVSAFAAKLVFGWIFFSTKWALVDYIATTCTEAILPFVKMLTDAAGKESLGWSVFGYDGRGRDDSSRVIVECGRVHKQGTL